MYAAPLHICDDSALAYWRSLGPHGKTPSTRSRRPKMPSGKPDPERVRNLQRRCSAFSSQPLDLLVPCGEARTESAVARCHVHARALPAGSFFEIESGVFVSSPELCFARLAHRLTLPNLAQLGTEFCGRYGLSVDKSEAYARAPLSSASQIGSFLERFSGERGIARARAALPYVHDGSESPRETVVAELLDLPVRLGGCALRGFKLNHSIPTTRNAWKATGRRTLRCDLIWMEAKLVVEYDSDLHHKGDDRIASDATRRTALAHMGYEVVTVANRHLRNAAEFEIVARHLARRLGKRPRLNAEWLSRHIQLRNDLLDPY